MAASLQLPNLQAVDFMQPHSCRNLMHGCHKCRCGRIWHHHAQRKAVQRSAGTAPPGPPGANPQNPQAAASHPRAAVAPATDALPLLESGALMSALLLNPTHDSVRSLSVSLLKQLCLDTPHMTLRLVSRLAAMLSQAAASGQNLPHTMLHIVYVDCARTLWYLWKGQTCRVRQGGSGKQFTFVHNQ